MVPNFVPICQSVGRLFFPKWQPSTIFDLLYACVDHPKIIIILSDVCHCTQNLVRIGTVVLILDTFQCLLAVFVNVWILDKVVCVCVFIVRTEKDGQLNSILRGQSNPTYVQSRRKGIHRCRGTNHAISCGHVTTAPQC